MRRLNSLVEEVSRRSIVTYLLIALMLAGTGWVIASLLASPVPSEEPSTAVRSSAIPSIVETPVLATTARPPRTGRSANPEPSPERERLLLPMVAQSAGGPSATPSTSSTPRTSTATPSEPTPTPTPPPTDFGAVRAELQAQGKALAHVKIGFHAGPGGNTRGLGAYLQGLASAGVPAVIKSADAYGVCGEALRVSGDHVTVFRMSGGDLELPDYDLAPDLAAEEHWARIVAALPPEFDRRTWLEVMNEPDKLRADWLGRSARRLAELALRDGYRLAAFGWSSGEPEREDWETPGMRGFLSLAAQHPDRLAVALHEYSFSTADIANQYPSLVGRFQMLFQVCDRLGIERPTVLITEWGWEATKMPTVEQAMEDIAWASQLYGAYPEVKGAAMWYLGSGYGEIANQAQQLIVPMQYYAWSEYFVIEPGQKPTDPNQFRPD